MGYYFNLCESSGFLFSVCDCKHSTGNISEGLYNQIISGVDVSDEALTAAGYSGFTGYSNFNAPGYGEKQPSVLGDFYKGKYDFVDDNREKSSMEHSYGMGLFFSGNV